MLDTLILSALSYVRAYRQLKLFKYVDRCLLVVLERVAVGTPLERVTKLISSVKIHHAPRAGIVRLYIIDKKKLLLEVQAAKEICVTKLKYVYNLDTGLSKLTCK